MLPDCVKWQYGTNVSELEKVKLNIQNVRAGAYWKATSHYMMMLVLLNKLREYEVGCFGLRYFLTRKNFDLVCSLGIRCEGIGNFSVNMPDGRCVLTPHFGIAYSNARRRALTFYAGYSCPESGASFVVSKWTGSRFTFNFNVHKEMENAIQEWRYRMEDGFSIIDKFRKHILRENMLPVIMTEAGARNMIPWSRIGKVADTVKSMHQSVFHLCLSYSAASVGISPAKQMDRLHSFHALCREMYPTICDDPQDNNGYGIIPEIF